MRDLSFNLFDVFLPVLAGLGIYFGRRNGISRELIGLLKWLTIVFACAVIYEPIGTAIAGSGIFDLLSAFLLAYLGSALIMFLLFSFVQRRFLPRLLQRDAFGRAEYYLGMGSGVVRFACMLLVALAVLNARFFSPAEVRAMERFQQETYGTSIFPNLHWLQEEVFESSLAGPWIKQDLGFLLISPTPANSIPAPQQSAPSQPATPR